MTRLSHQLRRASAELAHLESQLSKLEARTAGKRAEVVRLRTEVATLRAAIAEESGGDQPKAAARAPKEESSGDLPVRRTNAIVVVLRRRSRPMSPSEITEALNELGRNEELRSVTATLAHLQKSHRVERVGRGKYVAP